MRRIDEKKVYELDNGILFTWILDGQCYIAFKPEIFRITKIPLNNTCLVL